PMLPRTDRTVGPKRIPQQPVAVRLGQDDRGTVRRQRDPVREGEPAVDLFEFAVGEETIEPADGMLGRGSPGIGEIEDTVLVKNEIVGTVKRFALVFVDDDRCLSVRVDTQDAVDLLSLVCHVERAVWVKRETRRNAAGVEELA